MMSLRIRLTGAEVADRLERMPAELRDTLDRTVRDIADQIFADSQELAPVDKGTLRKSGNVRYESLRATIGYNTPYAWYVHEGTAPHEIVPLRPGGVLVFAPSGARRVTRGGRPAAVFTFGGRTVETGLVYARRVMHPGTRPIPFLREALERVIPQVPDFVRIRVEAVLQRLGLA
jgi:hypothetical protein